jgi:Tfp pilus assembly protein PilE
MRDERGEFTLIGLMIALMIFTFVLFATYNAFDVFGRNFRNNQVRTDADDKARLATDTMARQLRNLATPTALQPNAVALASAYDVVFETVASTGTPPAANPQNIEFVRYCLDPSSMRLYTSELPPPQVTSSTTAPSTIGACPGALANWTAPRVVAQAVVNRYNGADRPVFTFDSGTNNQIHRVRVDLFIDTDPGKAPAEQEITSGVDLRNQDRAPTAVMKYTLAGTGIVVLDGTGSTDPDNDPLSFCWYDAAATGSVGQCGAGSVGDTPYFRYRTTSGNHTVWLTVTDPSGLPSSTSHQTIPVP